jgi:hypothetical protein
MEGNFYLTPQHADVVGSGRMSLSRSEVRKEIPTSVSLVPSEHMVEVRIMNARPDHCIRRLKYPCTVPIVLRYHRLGRRLQANGNDILSAEGGH